MPRTNNRNQFWAEDTHWGAIPYEGQAESEPIDEVFEVRDQRDLDTAAMSVEEVDQDFWDQYIDEQEQDERSGRDIEQSRIAEAERALRISPIRRGQCGVNKTQLREIQAHGHVWDYVPSGLRVRINNAVASDGRLFRLTNQERNNLRAAIHRGRDSRSISRKLNDFYLNITQW